MTKALSLSDLTERQIVTDRRTDRIGMAIVDLDSARYALASIDKKISGLLIAVSVSLERPSYRRRRGPDDFGRLFSNWRRPAVQNT